MASKAEIVKVVTALLEVYDKTLTDTAQDLYIRALESEDGERLREAAGRVISTAKFFPRVSELKDAIKAIKTERESLDAERWHDQRNTATISGAWRAVMSWDRETVGGTKTVIDWQTCPDCGQQYYKWLTCPDCSAMEPLL